MAEPELVCQALQKVEEAQLIHDAAFRSLRARHDLQALLRRVISTVLHLALTLEKVEIETMIRGIIKTCFLNAIESGKAGFSVHIYAVSFPTPTTVIRNIRLGFFNGHAGALIRFRWIHGFALLCLQFSSFAFPRSYSFNHFRVRWLHLEQDERLLPRTT